MRPHVRDGDLDRACEARDGKSAAAKASASVHRIHDMAVAETSCDECECASLATVSDDVSRIVASAFRDPLRPHDHVALAATCKIIRAALDEQTSALRTLHVQARTLCNSEVREAMHARTESSALAALAVNKEIYWAGCRLDNTDCRTLACLSRSGVRLAHVLELDLNDNMIADAGVSTMQRRSGTREKNTNFKFVD